MSYLIGTKSEPPFKLLFSTWSMLALFVAIGFPLHGSAEDSETIEPTEIFIFAPNRSNDEAPFSFKNVSADSYMDRQFGQEPSYLLSTTPGITSYSDSGSLQGYSYFRLRGIDQTRINMTLDGVPLNEPEDQGVYFSNYPDFFSSIDGYQLVRGVGSSQNGSASYAGSIRFQSHNLDQPRYTKLGAGAGAFGAYRGFAEYNSGVSEHQGVYLRAAEIHSDGYKNHSGNTSQSLFFKAGDYRERDDWSVSGFTGRQANNLAWIGASRDQIANNRRVNANSPEENDQFIQSLLQLQNVHRFDSHRTLSSSIYYNHLSGDYDFDLMNFLGLPLDGTLYNYRFDSNFLGAFSNYKIDYNHTRLTFALHGNTYDRQHRGSERSAGVLYTNTGRKQELNAVAQVEHDIGDVILLGDMQGRYARFNYSGDTSLESLDWSFFNPKIGATYLLSNATNVYYSVGRTGREPTRNDIFAGNDNLAVDPSGGAILGAKSPEYVTDHELGVRTKGQSWSVQTNAYYMDFEDEIVLKGQFGPNGLPLTQNVNQSYRSGLEFDATAEISPSLTSTTNIALNRSRIRASGEHFSPVLTPQLLANQGIRYTCGEFVWGGQLHVQTPSYIDFANTKTLNDYYTVDLYSGYTFDSLHFGVQLNNLLNRKYFTNGYIDGSGVDRYFVQAPANVYVTVTWNL